MMFSAVIFDLDETLILEEDSIRATFLETSEEAATRYGLDAAALSATARETCQALWEAGPCHAYCSELGISSTEGMWGRFTGDEPDMKRLRDWAPGYRASAWRDALLKHGVDDAPLAAHLAELHIVNRHRHHVLFDDSEPVIARLKTTHKIGLLTNGASDIQRAKIDCLQIEPWFDAIVVSCEAGFGKPDVRVFNIVLSALGVAPEAALMVGDNLERDVAGAQAAGMKGAWLNRAGNPRNGGTTPDIEVPDLLELERVLLG